MVIRRWALQVVYRSGLEEDIVFRKSLSGAPGMVLAMSVLAFGCASQQRTEAAPPSALPRPTVHYVEIVSDDADAVTALYERMLGLSFSEPDPDLGQARVALRPDGTLVGIRKPLAAHEHPVVRTYFAVDDIEQAVKNAEAQGAVIAYPPTRQGARGVFAIVIQGNVQHGLWQQLDPSSGSPSEESR